MTTEVFYVLLAYLPTYCNQILYYISLINKIRYGLTYLPTKNLMSYVNAPKGIIHKLRQVQHTMVVVLLEVGCNSSRLGFIFLLRYGLILLRLLHFQNKKIVTFLFLSQIR